MYGRASWSNYQLKRRQLENENEEEEWQKAENDNDDDDDDDDDEDEDEDEEIVVCKVFLLLWKAADGTSYRALID